MRNMMAAKLIRGKVDFQIYTESIGVETTVSLNIPLMAAYKAQVEEMARQLGLAWPDDWYSVLLRFPETIKSEMPASLSEEESKELFKVTEEAIDALMILLKKRGLPRFARVLKKISQR